MKWPHSISTSQTLPARRFVALRGFKRVHLEPGASNRCTSTLKPRDMSMVTEAGEPIVAAGAYTVSVGGGQPDTGAHFSGTVDKLVDIPE